ncbi:hypothetical protein [Clostridium algidicarnis]|uniref:hypothetical protein n=1 Tax=Clostridium algidicarnis TaxID=37659 RepID=UPI003FD85C5E
MLRFINQILTKIFVSLAVFIFALVLLGVNPSQLFDGVQQGSNALQEVKGSIGDIQNVQGSFQDAINSVNQISR